MKQLELFAGRGTLATRYDSLTDAESDMVTHLDRIGAINIIEPDPFSGFPAKIIQSLTTIAARIKEIAPAISTNSRPPRTAAPPRSVVTGGHVATGRRDRGPRGKGGGQSPFPPFFLMFFPNQPNLKIQRMGRNPP